MSTETVILVHGYAVTGAVMLPLAVRLRRRGYRAVTLTWHDHLADLRTNAERLARFCAAQPGERIHFVGHSLGGLLVLRMANDFPDPRTARIVLMGTPYRGSHVADWFAQRSLWRPFIARSVLRGIVTDRPRWSGTPELGVIAGTGGIGAGRLVPGLPQPNDGMVALAEALVPDAPTIVLPHSHTALLASRDAARQVAVFLATGRFDQGPNSASPLR